MNRINQFLILTFAISLIACAGTNSGSGQSTGDDGTDIGTLGVATGIPAVTIPTEKKIGTKIGSNFHFSKNYAEDIQTEASTTFTLAKSTGFTYGRIAFRTQDVGEVQNGTYKYSFSKLEHNLKAIDEMFRAGIVPVISITLESAQFPDTRFGSIISSPTEKWGWPIEANTINQFDINITKLCELISKRHPNSDFLVNFGNELNFNTEWIAKRGNYVTLLEQTIPHIRAVAPRAKLLSTNFAFLRRGTHPNPDPAADAVGSVQWLTSQPVWDVLDGISVSAYNSAPTLSSYPDYLDLKGQLNPPEILLDSLKSIRAAIGSKLFVIAETGTNSIDNPEVVALQQPAINNYIEYRQSNWNIRYVVVCLAANADVVINYEFKDSTNGSTPAENAFGLVDSSLNPKESYNVFQNFLQEFGQSNLVGEPKFIVEQDLQLSYQTRYKQYEAQFAGSGLANQFLRWTTRPEWSDEIGWEHNLATYPEKPTSFPTALQP
jgi:hypothetical protein